MEKIRLGRTNMMVSRLGFGGFSIQRDSEDEAVAIVKRCLDLGITFLDPATPIRRARSDRISVCFASDALGVG